MVIGKRVDRVAIFLTLIALVVVPVFIASCGQPEAPSDKISVVVSILPQAEFVDRVGGDKVVVSVMVPPGANPHVYEPTPSQLVNLAKAKMYAKVGTGIEFELAWMDKLEAVNRKMRVVDCGKGVPLIDMVGGEAQGGTKDPHIWMSPVNAKVMVQNIYEGLLEIDPANQDYYTQNRDAYLQTLAKLDQDIRQGLARVTDRRFMVFHPAFGYLAHEYNLTELTIEEEGKEPSAADLTRLIETARQYNLKVIFALPQFNPQGPEVIARAIGGRVVFIDDLGKDYIQNMYRILDELLKAMSSQ